MIPARLLVVASVLSLAMVAGCSWTNGLRSAAATEHNCPQERVIIVTDDGNMMARTVQLDVCGARRVYRDVGGSQATIWVDVTPSSSGGEAGAGEDTPRAPARTEWSDAHIRSLVRDLEPRIAECTGGTTLRLSLELDDFGRVRSADGNDGSPEQRTCVLRVLGAVDLPGEGRARRVQLEFAGAADASLSVPPAADLPTTIRERIDSAAARVLACSGSASAAVEATWSESGAVQLVVRGETDLAVNECAASAVGPIAVPPGTAPGRLLHPISR